MSMDIILVFQSLIVHGSVTVTLFISYIRGKSYNNFRFLFVINDHTNQACLTKVN